MFKPALYAARTLSTLFAQLQTRHASMTYIGKTLNVLGLLVCTSLLQACANAPLPPASQPLPDPLVAGWKGAPVCEQLAITSEQRVLRCTFPPGVGHERHFHAPHVGYALSGGRMRLHDDSGVREVDLATGSHYTSSGTNWHEVLNVGTTTVQYLIVEPL